MKFSYDPEVDILDILLQEGKYDISEEVAEGIVVDLDKKGNILSIEIMYAKDRLPQRTLYSIQRAMKVSPSV